MGLYKTSAIVMKRNDLGESDRIVTFFSPGRGKIRATAKGVRKLTSRFSGKLETFSCVNLLVAEGRNLDVISQAELRRSFSHIREDLARIAAASYLLELIYNFTEEGGGDGGLYRLLFGGLAHLDEGGEIFLGLRSFEAKLSLHLGYFPALHRCASCLESRRISGGGYFSPALGGLLCAKCASRDDRSLFLGRASLEAIHFLAKTPFSRIGRLRLGLVEEDQLRNSLRIHLESRMEKRMMGPDFLESHVC
ncbi:MAG: DNA repair protein RecO [Armatimonadetes bacterium]|nr:DNA repair protein RecO [Armatimonadota bacterium]